VIHGVRPDGRSLMKIRKTKISVGTIGTADGSALVRIGHSSIIAGIRGEVGEATPISQKGQIVANVELTPLCSTRFRPGKPSEQAQVLAEFLNGIVTNTSFVSFDNIQIDGFATSHRLVWYLFVDLYCLNYDGNIQDGCLIALLASLKNLRLPQLTWDSKEEKLFENTELPKLSVQLLHYPVSLTFGTLDEFVLADPTSEEEELMSGSISIVVNNNGQLCSISKSGGTSINEEKLKECIQRTKQRQQQVMEIISDAEDNERNNYQKKHNSGLKFYQL